MKLKKLKVLHVNVYTFNVTWDMTKLGGASLSYAKQELRIGVKGCDASEIFMLISHELWEICALEMHVRFDRTDCQGDYVFVYDHRQHTTMVNMHAGLLLQFIV